jgi:hypothetical protein
VKHVTVFPDHLEVKIAGAPRLNVSLAEVGLSGRESQNVRVGEGTFPHTTREQVWDLAA